MSFPPFLSSLGEPRGCNGGQTDAETDDQKDSNPVNVLVEFL